MAEQTQVLSIEWLRDQVVKLLAHAARGVEGDDGSEPDHAACAKYADLLYKMLPKGSGDAAAASPKLAQEAIEELKLLRQGRVQP